MSNETSRSNAGLETREIGIEGMTCDHCVRRVAQALQRVEGVSEVSVSREYARARVTFERTKTDIPALHDAILKSGYKPAPVNPT
jgi:copper ion binding protein